MKQIDSLTPLSYAQSNGADRILPSFPDTGMSGLNFPASGPLPIPMTNDYLFRALLQRNNKVLKGLVCSLLHLSPKQLSTAEITNPIELGASITDKTFILDIKVLLNDQTVLNLEMQVINQHNWVERSLSYLCRNFDSLQSGETYQDIRPVLQIGILNFTLFPEQPEFYATYQLLNVKNHTLYSDKLRISVLNLTQIERATEEDKSCQLDSWASLFKATTWEELTMLAQNNEYVKEAADTVFRLCQDERVRMECEAREDYYRTQLGIQKMMDRQAAEIDAQTKEIQSQAAKIDAQAATLDAQTKEIQAQAAEIETQAATLNVQTAEIQAQTDQIEAQTAEIETQYAKIETQAAEIETQAAEIETQAAEIDKLKTWMREHGYDPADI